MYGLVAPERSKVLGGVGTGERTVLVQHLPTRKIGLQRFIANGIVFVA